MREREHSGNWLITLSFIFFDYKKNDFFSFSGQSINKTKIENYIVWKFYIFFRVDANKTIAINL